MVDGEALVVGADIVVEQAADGTRWEVIIRAIEKSSPSREVETGRLRTTTLDDGKLPGIYQEYRDKQKRKNRKNRNRKVQVSKSSDVPDNGRGTQSLLRVSGKSWHNAARGCPNWNVGEYPSTILILE